MRLVVQRVSQASVVDKESGKVAGQISDGLLVLVGVGKNDTPKDIELLALKLSKLRIMKDGEKKMNLTVKDVGGSLLVVSQFTLYADTSGGNRPSFIEAAEPKTAKAVYDCFVNELKNLGERVETGSFGAYMEISAVLDGPVTILY